MADIQPSGVLPFLKWAGGKRAMVPTLFQYIPTAWDRTQDMYIEPFLGGGALFFALAPHKAMLYDANPALITTYQVLRLLGQRAMEPWHFFTGLRIWEVKQRLEQSDGPYRRAREIINQRFPVADPEVLAAAFIFVNRAGFNGLWRVNAQGFMNVPWGKNPNVKIVHEAQLLNCAEVLAGRVFLQVNNALTLQFSVRSLKNALIYLDPPYAPISQTSDFTAYTAGGFTREHQLQLLKQMRQWRAGGAHILLTQAADPELLKCYENAGFNTVEVSARRAINSKGSARGPVSEYIIWHHAK